MPLQSLLAELEELYLACKVLSHDVLHLLRHRWLEVVLVDLIEMLDLIVVNISGTSEESRNIFLKHGERRVHVLEDANDGVVTLDDSLGFLERSRRVERSAMR